MSHDIIFMYPWAFATKMAALAAAVPPHQQGSVLISFSTQVPQAVHAENSDGDGNNGSPVGFDNSPGDAADVADSARNDGEDFHYGSLHVDDVGRGDFFDESQNSATLSANDRQPCGC